MAAPSSPARPLLERGLLVVEIAAAVAVVAFVVGRVSGAAATVSFLAIGVALALAGYFVFRMVGALADESLDARGQVLDEDRLRLEHEKQLLLHGIKELEADLGTGKVDPRDYAVLRRSAEARALEIIRVLRETDDRWLAAAQALVEQRLGRPPLAARLEADGAEKKLVPTTPKAAERARALTSERAPVAAAAPSAEAPAAHGPVDAATTAHPAFFDPRPVRLVAEGDGLVCSGCGAQSPIGVRFCTGCGRPRAAEGSAS
jgi:hypothetical protein